MVGADRRFGGWGGLSPGRSSWQSLSRELVVLAPTKQRPLLKAALPPSQVTKPAAISRGSKMQRLKNALMLLTPSKSRSRAAKRCLVCDTTSISSRGSNNCNARLGSAMKQMKSVQIEQLLLKVKLRNGNIFFS